jgi:DNA topoisomerase VI subunit B
MTAKYDNSIQPVLAYNRQKLENWVENQTEQLVIEMQEVGSEMNALKEQAEQAKDFLEKVDLRKEAEKKKKHLDKLAEGFHASATRIQEEAAREIAAFEESMRITPILVVNTVLKF